MMNQRKVKKRMDVAAGRVPADIVIKNAQIIDVYSGCIRTGDIAISDDTIAGIGSYEGHKVVDANGRFVAPGLIDGHIHIESSYVSPEEFGRLVVPFGTTTVIADPHEIVNVCGLRGLDYMLEAAEETALDIKYMIPSCVPATPYEHAGAVIDAKAMLAHINHESVLGLGEFMNFPGVIEGSDDVMDKLMVAYEHHKLVDGHSPGVSGERLNAYAAAQIHTDHECSTVEEMQERITRGMYVLLREGSACKDLRNLLRGVTATNSRRCVLCSDDRQPKTIFEEGHMDAHLRICIEEGIPAVTAIQMATLNAAECYRLYDRGAVAPGLRADLILFDSLDDIRIDQVFIAGKEVAKDGTYLLPVKRHNIEEVSSTFRVKDFTLERLNVTFKSNRVHVIDLIKDSVVTKKAVAEIALNDKGEFVFEPERGIAKVAVIERHQNTGNVAVGFLRGYGIMQGAIALSVAHDSHNIITVGVNDSDMHLAVQTLIAQGGGIVLVKDGNVLECMPMPIGGLMSDQNAQWVEQRLTSIHEKAVTELGIADGVEPVMTLCFMSLPVIPEVKITDMGLFDVTTFTFLPLEVE